MKNNNHPFIVGINFSNSKTNNRMLNHIGRHTTYMYIYIIRTQLFQNYTLYILLDVETMDFCSPNMKLTPIIVS